MKLNNPLIKGTQTPMKKVIINNILSKLNNEIALLRIEFKSFL